MDTGFFGHATDKQGSRISLLGTDEMHRVWAGPSDDVLGGIVKVYYSTIARARGSFYAVPGSDGMNASAVLHIRGGEDDTQKVYLAIDGLTVRKRRTGDTPSEERDLLAMLKIEEGRGGVLTLRGPGGNVEIDADGIHVEHDKAGFAREFVAQHPNDPSSDIHYVVTEGPEVGVFVRGTLTLEKGKARAVLPDHFAHVASAENLTVQLTPRSERSKGVAVVKATASEIEVRELHRGKGNYDVDWLVQGVRKGCEDFRVVRPRADRVPRVVPAARVG